MADLQIDEGALQAVVMPQLEQFANAFISRTADQARQLVNVRTGYLKSTISADKVTRVGPWELSGGVSAGAPYAGFVHEGTRPHVIRPRRARALRFEIGGRVVFAQRVNHPGYRGNAFLRNAAHRVASADPRIAVGER